MKQVLFVDDEIKILQGLKRLLRPMRKSWEMEFEVDSRQALKLIEEGSYDIVVSDMRMPVVNGVQVLKHTQKHCPQAVRIALSGYSDAQLVLEAAGVIHQFLSKPCEPESLIMTVDHIVALQQRLANPELQRAISSLSALPSLPDLYVKITREATSENGSMQRVGEIVAHDIGMTTKLLQIVNSAYFGLKTRVSSPAQAASLMGFDALRTLVLALDVFKTFEATADQSEVKQLWSHSLATGSFAQQIACHLGLEKKAAEQAMLAGMLHDVGRLILMSERPEQFKKFATEAFANATSELDREDEVFGCNHMDVGAYLLTLWGFPYPVVEGVAYHHTPSEVVQPSASPLSAVHIGEAFARSLHQSMDLADQLDQSYLASIEDNHSPEDWQTILKEIQSELEESSENG